MEPASNSSDSLVPQKPRRFSQSPKGNGESCPSTPRALPGLQSCCQRPKIRCAWGYPPWCSLSHPCPHLMVWVPAQLSHYPTLQKLSDFSSRRCLPHNLPWPLSHPVPSAWNALTPCPHHLQNLILAYISPHQGSFPGSLSAKMVPSILLWRQSCFNFLHQAVRHLPCSQLSPPPSTPPSTFCV